MMGISMEEADMLLVRIQEAREHLEKEALRIPQLSPSLHEAIVEAGVALDDALAVLTHFRQICDAFVPGEPGAKLILK
jgi:hypothetical protein